MKKGFILTTLILIVGCNFYAQNSVLSSGNWKKLSTFQEGVHKITFTDLQLFGINPTAIDPRKIKLFGNGGGMLAEANNVPKIIDLEEMAIEVVGESDGVFNTTDYILFYAETADEWLFDANNQQFLHKKNIYSDSTYYFLTVGTTNGKRIIAQNSSAFSPTNTTTQFDLLTLYEVDSANLIKSGREWFGDGFNNGQNSRDYVFNQPNVVIGSQAFAKVSSAVRSSSSTTLSVTAFAASTSISYLPVNITNSEAIFANINNGTHFFTPTTPSIFINLTYNFSAPNSLAWLDYIELQTRNNLTKSIAQLVFRDKNTVGVGNITNFQIASTLATDKVWEVTNFNDVKNQNKLFNAGTTSFTLATDSLRTFVVFDEANLPTPSFVKNVSNQNLHGISSVNMIILTHPNFVTQANNLDNFHLTQSGLVSEIVTVEQVYNEFSSGKQDVVAINDFMEFLYQQPNSDLMYLLLLGDASYDYKNRLPTNTNFVPTYESPNSINPLSSFNSDDYYGLLDPTEGLWTNFETIEIGIGRLPVKNQQEATDVVAKIIAYKNNITSFGNWRNTVTFIGDDEDNNIHMAQANELADSAEIQNCAIILNKIYLDAFTQVVNGSQQSYPDAELAIIKTIRNGTLILNYNGHAGVAGLATENVFDTLSLGNFGNLNLYPLFFYAGSDVSRFDNPNNKSFSEHFLIKNNEGFIAAIGGGRVSFSNPAFFQNKVFYELVFQKTNNEHKTLGETFMQMKNQAQLSISKHVSLLGDPALTLNFNEFNVVANIPDTLQNNAANTVFGSITDDNSTVQNWFNGNLVVFIQSPKTQITTLANDGGTPFVYSDRLDTLFLDTIPVINGSFSFNLNITNFNVHAIGNAKINFYAENGSTDASGCGATFVNDLLTSTTDFDAQLNNIIVFPNPSNGIVSVTNLDMLKGGTIEVVNLLGQPVSSHKINSSSVSIDLTASPKGIYIVKIVSSNANLNYKIVLE